MRDHGMSRLRRRKYGEADGVEAVRVVKWVSSYRMIRSQVSGVDRLYLPSSATISHIAAWISPTVSSNDPTKNSMLIFLKC